MSKTPIDQLLDRVDWKRIDSVPHGEDVYVTHHGQLHFMGHVLDCARLSDGKTVFTEDSLARLFGCSVQELHRIAALAGYEKLGWRTSQS